MDREEFLLLLKNVSIDPAVKIIIENLYGKKVPLEIIKILSMCRSPELFDENESRTLSIEEVMFAEKDNGVPFQSKSLIPIIDCGNNDFIVYNTDNGKWLIYNILEEILFDETDLFETLFLS